METERCVVREITLEDLPELRKIYEQKGITDYLEPLYGEAEEIAYTKAYIEKRYRFFEYGMWVVFHKETGCMIGRAGLENRDVAVGVDEEGQTVYESQVELGYMIAPAFQRQGYASEVCRAILRYAKQELEIPFVNAFIHHENIASLRFIEKMNFQLCDKKDGIEQDSAMVRYMYV